MNKVKLVIWDLDETFWRGTLSEGSINIIDKEIVPRLTKIGIINSISSKNDFQECKDKLTENDLWDYFVFPSINWNPKGESIKQIIEDCQLRAENVVFIDDNPGNLNEAVFYNPGIMTYDSIVSFLNDFDFSLYKPDEEMNRLNQYKSLEKKKQYKVAKCSSNIDFLEKSDIRILFIEDIEPIKERLLEMIERTNQLNYTKLRIGLSELDALIVDKDVKCVAVHVMDNFGDYGICGFYALNTKENRLIHFLFSCRILNIGVENYVYQKLGRPSLSIVDPITTKLVDKPVYWIKEITKAEQKDSRLYSLKKCRIALIGGCDLYQLCHYINDNAFTIIKDFNYNSADNIAIHREHTIFQRMAGNISDMKFKEMIKLPFLDEKCLDYHYLHEQYDYFVFSPLMNYTQEIYHNHKYDFDIAYGGYNNILESDSWSVCGGAEGFNRFKSEYDHIGQQSPTDFYNDLEWLYNKVKTPIIFLNGAEVDIDNPNEEGATLRNRTMNQVLNDFVKDHSDRCQIIDVNQFIKDRDDLEDNIRHYKRFVYVELAKELMKRCGKDVRISRSSYLKGYILSIIRKMKIKVAKLIR